MPNSAESRHSEPPSLEQLGRSILAKIKSNDELKFEGRASTAIEKAPFEVDGVVEFVRESLAAALKEDRMPPLRGSPYPALLTRIADGRIFEAERVRKSDMVGIGFIPTEVNKARLATNLELVARTLVRDMKAEKNTDIDKKKTAAERAVYNALLILLERGFSRAFRDVPIDITPFVKDKSKEVSTTAKSVFKATKVVEAKVGTEVEEGDETAAFLKELGIVESIESDETNEILKDIEESRKLAIMFYRELGKTVKEAQIKLSRHSKGRKLKGQLARIDPYVENSQASLFTLLSRAFDKTHQNGSAIDQETLSKKNEAQILAYLTYLILKLKTHPSFEAILYHSQRILERFVKHFFDGTETSEVTVQVDRDGDAIINGDNLEPHFQDIKTIRKFKGTEFEGIPDDKRAVYVEDMIREKMLFSILLKVITGELEIENVPDMLAGQCALVGLKKEDLYHEVDETEDRSREVESNLRFVDAMAIKAANAAGCTTEVPESKKHYRKLEPGEFQINRKVHGSKGNEKSHDFSAIKLYMCFKAKNGGILRMEYRFVPWNTYHKSKSKKSVNSDEVYALKKSLQFGRYAIRKSQNPRFVEVVEETDRLLKIIEEEAAQRQTKPQKTPQHF